MNQFTLNQDSASVQLVTADKTLLKGGLELVQRWQDEPGSVIWVDIQAEPSKEEVSFLTSFGCHALAIKDAHRERHPPKLEHFEDHTFLLFRGIHAVNSYLDIEHLQIALFVGDNFIITRHNTESRSIYHWKNHPDLASAMLWPPMFATKLLHFACGIYLEKMLDFEEQLSAIEDLMQSESNDTVLRELTLYKTQLRKLRRVFDYHQRLSSALRDIFPQHFPRDKDELQHATQDLYERCERLHSLSSMYYEICGDLIDGYLSLASHQLNLTMRILTVITAIFVPLGFIAGLYGMNFEYMPELQYRNAYFITLGVMISTAATLLLVFWKKRWL